MKRMLKNIYKKIKGFSLIEVLVSLFILVFFIFLIIEIFPYSVKAIKMSKKVLLATQIAKKELEFAKQIPWDDLNSGSSYLQDRKTNIESTINGISSTTSFESFYTVTPLPEDPDNIKILQVVVRWDVDASGNSEERKKVEMEVLVSKDL